MAIADVNSPSFQERMQAVVLQQLQHEINNVAAPIIEKALAEIRREMLVKLGGMTVALFQSSYDIFSNGQNLVLKVVLTEPKDSGRG